MFMIKGTKRFYRPLRRSCPKAFRFLRKTLFFLFFLLVHADGRDGSSSFCFPTAAGQERSFEAGVAGGLNTSQISGDDLRGFHQFGAAGGLFVARPVSDRIALELQFLFSQKGSRKAPDPEKGDYTSYNLRVDYIDMPFLVKYRMEGFDLFAGALLGAKVGNAQEEDHNGPISNAGRPDFEAFDLGIHGGATYYLNSSFTLDLRFSNSVLPARKFTGGTVNNRGTGQYLNRGQYHTVVTFLVKYRILGQ